MNNLDEVDPEDEPRTYRSKTLPAAAAGDHRRLDHAHAHRRSCCCSPSTRSTGSEPSTGRVGIAQRRRRRTRPTPAGVEAGDIVVVDRRSAGRRRPTTFADHRSAPRARRRRRPSSSSATAQQLDHGGRRSAPTRTTATASARRSSASARAARSRWINESVATAVGDSVTDLGTGRVAERRRRRRRCSTRSTSIGHLAGANDRSDARSRRTVVGISRLSVDDRRRDRLRRARCSCSPAINVFVGLFNLVPLLPFDGGHAAIATYERIRDRATAARRTAPTSPS